jgi:hypothetical protein
MSHAKQEQHTLPEHMGAPSVFSWVRVVQHYFFSDLWIIICLFVFFQQLYCLSFSDLWLILIKPVVFSKFTEDIASPDAITNGHNYEPNKIDVP